MNSEEVFGRRS